MERNSATNELINAIKNSSFHFSSNGQLIVENTNLFNLSHLSKGEIAELLSELEERDNHDDVDKEIARFVYMLKFASLSMTGCLKLIGQIRLSKNVSLTLRDQEYFWQTWIESYSLLSVIHKIFDCQIETFPLVWKKFALDLGYILLTNSLDFSDRSFGFRAPLSVSDASLIFLVAKYLESFMVTFPAHYPFMPEKYFSDICWPISIAESCSGKVHSLFRFSQASDNRKIKGATELEENPQLTSIEENEESIPRYCNYENSRRQPWGGKFSIIQIMELVREILESIDINFHSTNAVEVEICEKMMVIDESFKPPIYATEAELNQCLLVLKDVIRRVKIVDSSLLFGEKPKTPKFLKESYCYICNQPHVHHCRLCLHSICVDCCKTDESLDSKFCLECHHLLFILDLSNIDERRNERKSDTKATKHPSDQYDVSPEHVNDLADLATISTCISRDEEFEPSPCCSVCMSASLKDWRDRDDDY